MHLSCDSGRCPKLKKDSLAELHYIIYAPAASTVIRQFSVIFDTIAFMSASSSYVYIQKRGYRLECRLLPFEILFRLQYYCSRNITVVQLTGLPIKKYIFLFLTTVLLWCTGLDKNIFGTRLHRKKNFVSSYSTRCAWNFGKIFISTLPPPKKRCL